MRLFLNQLITGKNCWGYALDHMVLKLLITALRRYLKEETDSKNVA